MQCVFQFGIVIFCRKEISTRVACKMLLNVIQGSMEDSQPSGSIDSSGANAEDIVAYSGVSGINSHIAITITLTTSTADRATLLE
jgi:hypothetical protein